MNPINFWRRACGAAMIAVAATAFLFSSISLAQNKDEKAQDSDSKTSRLRVEVTGGEKSVPVDMASIYVKFVEKRVLAKDQQMEMDVKTNREGVAIVPVVPRGKIILQVVAKGWKPFGEKYELVQEQEVVKIHLDRPPKWY